MLESGIFVDLNRKSSPNNSCTNGQAYNRAGIKEGDVVFEYGWDYSDYDCWEDYGSHKFIVSKDSFEKFVESAGGKLEFSVDLPVKITKYANVREGDQKYGRDLYNCESESEENFLYRFSEGKVYFGIGEIIFESEV